MVNSFLLIIFLCDPTIYTIIIIQFVFFLIRANPKKKFAIIKCADRFPSRFPSRFQHLLILKKLQRQ